ncbi:MAG: hypothetical protein BA864_06910 [Desulfuromonadales bacterium C00003093]|nr:MAG: hypothetical protein BA864_06910 [Desulfuromonadales bacterium C00003093]
MPDKSPDTPQVIQDSAMVLMVVLHELGFSDKPLTVLNRGKELLDSAMTKNTAVALGDDLDAYSVAVGFAAAMGAFANCLGETDGVGTLKTKIDRRALILQMQKAEDN